MTDRRDVLLTFGVIGGATLLTPSRLALAAEDCQQAIRDQAIGNALLDKYVAAVNAHDTNSFAEIHTESYIQHSGRSPNGLPALIENFRGIFGRMPDVRAQVEDRIIAGAFDLPEGTIYPVLHRLEQAGLLGSRWVTADSGRRRRVYAITRRGQRELAERRAVWEQFSDAIGGLFRGSRPHRNPA